MSQNEYIEINIICKNYRVEPAWIDELIENELLQIEESDLGPCIHEEQLSLLERMINLDQDLGVNVPGIEVILNLLERIETLEQQLS